MASAATSQQTGADRPLQERHRIAARYDHRATQMILKQRPEHEAKQKRRRLAVELDQHVADQAEYGDSVDVEGVEIDGKGADAGERDDGGKQHPVGNRQKLHPEADQRQVEQHQEKSCRSTSRRSAPRTARARRSSRSGPA